MKNITLILLLAAAINFANAQSVDNTQLISTSQSVDTIIQTGIYKSYYSYTLKEPLYVTYTLTKGGGDCNRSKEGFRFTDCGCEISASTKDYAHTGYDQGHLVNAEDFAFDCVKEKQTFCFYNCLPQTAKLNRGIWKHWETTIRDLSQTKPLFIITGGIYGSKTIGENNIAVPDYCYKVVMDAASHKTIYCLLFPNDQSNSATSITYDELKVKLGYPVAESDDY